jgi:hypothetical protein
VVPLLRVDNIRPTLPRALLSEAHFADSVSRIFPEAQAADIWSLWALADGAAEQEHGTMLVVHRDAAGEAGPPRASGADHRTNCPQQQRPRAMTNIDGTGRVSPDNYAARGHESARRIAHRHCRSPAVT